MVVSTGQATLAAILADTASLDAKFDVNLSTRASEATLLSVDTKLTDGTQQTQITDADGGIVDVNTKGNRTGLSIEYPELLSMMSRISAQLEKIIQHIAIITDEDPEEPFS